MLTTSVSLLERLRPRRLKGHKGPLRCLALSADGKHLASAGQDRQILLWDLDSHTMQPLVGHLRTVTSLSFSPNGKTLASGSEGGPARLRHVRTAQEIRQLETPKTPVYALAFTPDGRFLVAAAQGPCETGNVFLWLGEKNDRRP